MLSLPAPQVVCGWCWVLVLRRAAPLALQGAQLTVLAFPHELRVFGVADCVALDAGQPSAAELLAQGAAEVGTLLCTATVQLHHGCTACGHCMRLAVMQCCKASNRPAASAGLLICLCWLLPELPGRRTYMRLLERSRASHFLLVLQPDLPLLALEDALSAAADTPAAPAADCDMTAA